MSLLDSIESFLADSYNWLVANLLTISALVQVITVGLLGWVAYVLARRSAELIKDYYKARYKKSLKHIFGLSLQEVLFLAFFGFFVGLGAIVVREAGWPNNILVTLSSLVIAWVLIRITSGLIENSALSKFVALIIWVVAALNILDLLQPTLEFLSKISWRIADFEISILTIFKGIAAFAILVWVAKLLNQLVARRFKKIRSISPSQKVLFMKFQKIALFALVIIIGLDFMGIDLTVLAVFSGAVGIGIGFGLQKIFANLVSGIILILDKSIKPGDVLVIDGQFGWVKALEARYVSIITRDGKEHLIPNEHLITQTVENWSFTDDNIRLKLPVGVSYDCDIHKARDLMLKEAKKHQRVLEAPAPTCPLLSFGDSSVNFELRIWINDPVTGTGNVSSELLFAIWDAFKKHGIAIPYPQRDIHIKTGRLAG